MYRWQGLAEVPGEWGRSVVTIGVFDGVHRGHQRIIARAVQTASEAGLPMVVLTFDPHPVEVIRPGSHPPYLCTAARRAELLAELGADAVCVLPFTREFSQLGPDEFVRSVLAERLHTAAVVVGENFRFGHRAAGDVALLTQLGEKYDFTAEGVPLLGGHSAISSSGIRQMLAAGDVEGAAAGLGRMHRVEGVVVPGHRRGRAMGFPTANLQTFPHTAIPADGVYAGWLARPGEEGAGPRRWAAAISVGTNPTFEGRERVVEAYALDAGDPELYGAHVTVDFASRLRGMERFGTADELASQMREDVARVRGLARQPGGLRPG